MVQRTAALEPLAASSDLPNVPVSARMSLDVLNGPSSSPELGLFLSWHFQPPIRVFRSTMVLGVAACGGEGKVTGQEIFKRAAPDCPFEPVVA